SEAIIPNKDINAMKRRYCDVRFRNHESFSQTFDNIDTNVPSGFAKNATAPLMEKNWNPRKK
ncbi:9435_t:CDS:2, partial [Acaulospora morrowiae]